MGIVKILFFLKYLYKMIKSDGNIMISRIKVASLPFQICFWEGTDLPTLS